MNIRVIVKAFVVTGLTAVASAWLVTTLIVAGTPAGWLAMLFFTIPGAVLLTSVYGATYASGLRGWHSYIVVLAIGMCVAGVELVLPLGLPGFATGVAAGALTAFCWIILHYITHWWRAPTDHGAKHA